MNRSFAIVSFVLLGATTIQGCKQEHAEPTRAAPEPSSSGGKAVPITSTQAPEAPKDPPTLVAQPAFQGEASGGSLYASGKELLVLSDNRIGRVVGDKIEWFYKFERGEPGAFGYRMLRDITGTYPDGLFGYLVYENGRAPVPGIAPLTGKGGQEVVFAPGGGWGNINGVATVGESVVVHGEDNYEGPKVLTVRGPRVERYIIPASSQGCENTMPFPKGALNATAFGGAKNGMLAAVGDHCSDEKQAAVEIWPPNETKPKLVKLDRKKGDFFVPFSSGSILEIRGDQVTQLPETGDLQRAYLEPDGTLAVVTQDAILKLDEGAWKTAARLAFGTRVRSIARHDGTLWIGTDGGIARLVEGKPSDYTDECKTPFVFLYDVSWKAEPTYTFPTTRKALSTFADKDKIKLVEIALGKRRLGLTVPDKKVGEAVIAHVKANMKDENPKLLCLSPQVTREIKLDGKP
jgi:hypothetical protein